MQRCAQRSTCRQQRPSWACPVLCRHHGDQEHAKPAQEVFQFECDPSPSVGLTSLTHWSGTEFEHVKPQFGAERRAFQFSTISQVFTAALYLSRQPSPSTCSQHSASTRVQGAQGPSRPLTASLILASNYGGPGRAPSAPSGPTRPTVEQPRLAAGTSSTLWVFQSMP